MEEGNYVFGGMQIGRLIVGGTYDYLSAYNYVADLLDFPEIPLHVL